MLKKLKKLPISTHSVIRMVIWFAGIFIGLVCSQFEWLPGAVVGLILMLGGFAWHYLFLRCPHCRQIFNLRYPIPKYCPNCGKQILS